MSASQDEYKAPNLSARKRRQFLRNLRHRKLVLAVGILLALFVLYVLVGFFVVPPVMEHLAVTRTERILDRPASIGEVRFNPLRLSLEVNDFAIYEPDGNAELASFEQLSANVESVSLVRLALILENVGLVGPYLHAVYYEDGSTNIQALLPKGEDDGEAPETPGPQEPQEALQPLEDGLPRIFPFLLNDISIENGRLVLEDRAFDATHEITDLTLTIPFVSSLEGDREEYVRPELSATVNGSPLRLDGRTLPFAESLRTEFDIAIEEIDLVKYRAYAPLPEGLRLASGKLRTDLSLGVERSGVGLLPVILLSGSAELTELALDDVAAEETLLELPRLAVELGECRLLEKDIVVSSIQAESLRARVVRRTDGSINVVEALGIAAAEEKSEQAQPLPAMLAEPVDIEVPLSLTLGELTLRDGRIDVTDRMVGFEKQVGPVSLDVRDLTTGSEQPATIDLTVGEQGAERITVDAQAALAPTLSATAKVDIENLDPSVYEAYYAEALPMRLAGGTVSAGLEAGYPIPEDGPAATNISATVDQPALALPDADEPFLRAAAVSLSGGEANLSARRIQFAELAVTEPDVDIVRTAEGDIDILNALQADQTAQPEQPTQPKPGQPSEPDQAPIVVGVSSISVNGGTARLQDRTVDVSHELRDIGVTIEGFSTTMAEPVDMQASAALAAGGTLELTGQADLAAPSANGEVTLADLNVAVAGPYLRPMLPATPTAGGLSVSGTYEANLAEGLAAGFQGEVRLTELACEGEYGGEALTVSEISATRIDAAVNPGDPPLRFAAGDIVIDQPRGLVTIGPRGVVYIGQAPPDLEAGEGELPRTKIEAEPAASETAKPADVVVEAEGQPAKPLLPPLPPVVIDAFRVNGGRVDYTDMTVIPAFEGQISQVDLAATNIDTTTGAPAKIDLAAQVLQSTLTAEGNVAAAESLDVQMKADLLGLELAPLSPYTERFIGYPILLGRLDLDSDVDLAGSALDTTNTIVISNITLGDKAPEGPNLPVPLAISLLEDSDRTMTLNIPIQGDVTNPQFSLSSVIAKATGSLITSVVTAPFQILGSIFGAGDEDLEHIPFPPGEPTLTEGAQKKVGILARVLRKRPRVAIELAGRYDPQADRRAIEDERFRNLLRTYKRAEIALVDKNPPAVEDITIGEDEYVKYLTEAYEEEDFEKPGGILGPDEQPVEVMEQKLREYIAVSQEDLVELARKRAEATRQGILNAEEMGATGGTADEVETAGGGPLDPERIELSEPGPVEAEGDAKTKGGFVEVRIG